MTKPMSEHQPVKSQLEEGDTGFVVVTLLLGVGAGFVPAELQAGSSGEHLDSNAPEDWQR